MLVYGMEDGTRFRLNSISLRKEKKRKVNTQKTVQLFLCRGNVMKQDGKYWPKSNSILVISYNYYYSLNMWSAKIYIQNWFINICMRSVRVTTQFPSSSLHIHSYFHRYWSFEHSPP